MFKLFSVKNKPVKIAPQVFAERLHEALPVGLRAVMLYGSAARGEYVQGRSNYNTFLLVESWSVLELNQISKVAREWLLAGNPSPIVFTLEWLQNSADCFPIEMLDILESYRVLWGEDLLKDVKVRPVHLRLMAEREIKSLMLRLCDGFVAASGDDKKILRLMTSTISAAYVLIRAALRLQSAVVPQKRSEALAMLAEQISIDKKTFETIGEMKYLGAVKSADAMALFDSYIRSLNKLAEYVDSHGKMA